METNYREYYSIQLSEAQEYQDWCTTVFIKELGVAVTNYQSKKYQYNVGENVQGLEIKNDKKFRETGNLYIEVKEKSHPSNPNYVKSGIYRLDNSWLYCIGDYNIIYIFAKKHLQLIYEAGKYREVTTPTSIGFLLPINDADKYCAKRIIIEATNG